nr:ABC transporter permease subunit [Tessaracoccus sp. MC1627]
MVNNWPQVVELSIGHLLLTLPAVLISILVAVPLGRLAFRRPRFGATLLAVASLLYAVPALPLLIVIPVILGTPLRSAATMIAALSAYGVALLVRSVADGFGSVDERVRDAAVAVGHSPSSVFWRVDLPLSTPVILAGVRVMTVSTVGLVTIGALIGVPSLGTLLTDGFQRGIVAEVGTGVVLTVLLALVLDGLLVVAGHALTPWTRASGSSPAVAVEVRR